MLEGVLNLDKPAGLTSARTIDRIKRLLPRKTKIGHAGTLDPFATGVLLVLVGKATRQCEALMDAPKQYEATIKLGATTATDDPESPEQPWPGARPVERASVEAVLPRFVGTILQRPPAYSALKVGGRRAYELARGGETVQLEPRQVNVYDIRLLDYQWPLLRVRIDCGRGTYIRALGRDIGEALGTGGYVLELRRTRVGEFDAQDALSLDDLSPEQIIQILHKRTS
jgi:tRNA pseudouridine55 synthase